MNKKKIAVLVGSLRKDSFNKKIANKLISLAPDTLDMKIVEIGHLPHYNQDSDGNSPIEFDEFRAVIKDAEGYLFVSPEYNRSIPGVLKNAIDIASRPWGQNVWGGKPAAIATTSIGAIGGFGANHILRQTLAFLNVYTMQQPEAYIGDAFSLFDEDGNLINADTEAFLQNFINAFAEWANKF